MQVVNELSVPLVAIPYEKGTDDNVLETMLNIIFDEFGFGPLPLPKFYKKEKQVVWSKYNIKIIYNNTYYILTTPGFYNYKTFSDPNDLREKALVMARAINSIILNGERV